MQESVYRNVTNQKQLSAQDLENVMMNKINELNKQQSNDVPYHFKSGEMCKRIVLEENLLSIFVPDCYVTQEKKLFSIIQVHQHVFLITIRSKRCVKEMLQKNFGCQNMFMTDKSHRKCVIKQLKGGHIYWEMSKISKKLREYVKEFLKGYHLCRIIFLVNIR